jgi:hypothetical protein
LRRAVKTLEQFIVEVHDRVVNAEISFDVAAYWVNFKFVEPLPSGDLPPCPSGYDTPTLVAALRRAHAGAQEFDLYDSDFLCLEEVVERLDITLPLAATLGVKPELLRCLNPPSKPRPGVSDNRGRLPVTGQAKANRNGGQTVSGEALSSLLEEVVEDCHDGLESCDHSAQFAETFVREPTPSNRSGDKYAPLSTIYEEETDTTTTSSSSWQ